MAVSFWVTATFLVCTCLFFAKVKRWYRAVNLELIMLALCVVECIFFASCTIVSLSAWLYYLTRPDDEDTFLILFYDLCCLFSITIWFPSFVGLQLFWPRNEVCKDWLYCRLCAALNCTIFAVAFDVIFKSKRLALFAEAVLVLILFDCYIINRWRLWKNSGHDVDTVEGSLEVLPSSTDLSSVEDGYLRELKVPRHANFGETITLECLFELDRGSLYSVKWYKDDDEFFRYMPDSNPKARLFSLPGIRLVVERSNMSQVTLGQVDYSSSGTYRCEVSTEAPDFETALQNKNMTIVAYPDSPPRIVGALSVYSSADEHIFANCSSGKSNPPPHLSWYVNGVKAKHYYTTDSGVMEHEGPVFSSWLALNYPLSRLDSGSITLNCSSAVAGLPPLSSLFVSRLSSASAEPAKQRLHNDGMRIVGWPFLLVACLLS